MARISYVAQGILVIMVVAVQSFRSIPNQIFCLSGTSYYRGSLLTCNAVSLDSRELTKIFGRFAAKSILLDIPGAGTPEMANCCHGGCDNCNYSHSFDNLSAGRAKWVPTYSSRTLIDGRSEKAPWANIFDSDEDEAGKGISLDKATFTRRIQQLPYAMAMGPGTSVPADEPPLDEAVAAFWDILLTTLAVDNEMKSTFQLDSEQMATALTTLTGQPHGAMWMDFRKPFHGS